MNGTSRRSRPLAELARDAGFTPSVRDLAELVDLLADDELQKDIERAIVRAGAGGFETLRSRFETAAPPLRGRILRVIGRLARTPARKSLLIAALGDADPKTRRNAAIALGRVDEEKDDRETALLGAWDRDPRADMRRTLAASLGKVGSRASLPRLAEAARSEDGELARIAERAIVMIERTTSRGEAGRLIGARAPARPVEVLLLSRRGLETLLAEEVSRQGAAAEVRVEGPGRVRARLLGELASLMSARILLGLRFPVAATETREGESTADCIARLATSDLARSLLGTWSETSVRYRIEWEGGGHKRSATWETALAIGRLEPAWINDPTASPWGFAVRVEGRTVGLDLVPRGLEDHRFDWRRGDVPASSHPTIAAALAWVAGSRADDVVWDPFVGSGAELVERAMLGPFASLNGTDVDARALKVARANLSAAGVSARLEQADALTYAIRPTLVLTNPPMGRRASRMAGLRAKLDRFVTHVAAALVPGGRFVWMAPWPESARRAASLAGLSLEWARLVDMDGFDAELQRWRRP
jgi:23S rRNA G2445 N2-methylase RlmL